MYIITLNYANIVPDGENNKLVYKFPNSVPLIDKYIALSSLSMYNSWFNIMSKFQNNTFTYTWTSGVTTTTYTITLPDGLYEVSDINKYIQFECINNGTYWITNGDYYYPFEVMVNPTRYAIQLNTYLIPTVAPTGTTTPAPAGWPTTSFNSIVSFPDKFNIVVGYLPTNSVIFSSNNNVGNAYIPPSPTKSNYYVAKDANGTLSYLSNTFPNVHPNDTIYLTMSNINNPYGLPSSIITTITSDVAIGEVISMQPPNYAWTKMIDGYYNELRFGFFGVDLQPLFIADPYINITLVIRDASEAYLGSK
jgi:hypothetical protein